MAAALKVGLILILVLALAAGSLFLGEAVLLIGYVVLPIAIIKRWPNQKVLGWTTGILFGAALLLHLWGFKLVGSATVVELESLRKPRRLETLEAPNLLRFTDGSTATIANVFFPQTIVLTNHGSGYYESFGSFRNLRSLVEPGTQPAVGILVEMNDPTNDASGAVYLRAQSYWCGNTWSPHFFPERLPRRVRADLAPVLVSAGVALPTPAYVAKNSRRNDFLIGALDEGVIPDLPQQHPEIERLAIALIELGHWQKGVELLVGTGAADTIASVNSRIARELEGMAKDASSSLGASNRWRVLQSKLDLSAAHVDLVQGLVSAELNVEQISALAGSMASFGDLRGFDLLIDRLAGQDFNSALARRLCLFLRSWFRFDIYLNGGGCPDDLAPEFVAWYRDVRPRLSCRRLPTGRQGFVLDDGIPFDPAYYASMKPFKERIAHRHGRPIHRERFFD